MPAGSWETILKAILELIWFGSSASVAFRIITRESRKEKFIKEYGAVDVLFTLITQHNFKSVFVF